MKRLKAVTKLYDAHIVLIFMDIEIDLYRNNIKNDANVLIFMDRGIGLYNLSGND